MESSVRPCLGRQKTEHTRFIAGPLPPSLSFPRLDVGGVVTSWVGEMMMVGPHPPRCHGGRLMWARAEGVGCLKEAAVDFA